VASPEQQRVLDIASFREELARLEGEGIVALDPQTREHVHAHHEAVLASLAARANVDLTQAAAQLSLGMRIATLLGASALSAAYGFFVASVWGKLELQPQLLLVALPPLLLSVLTHAAARREQSGYVASVLGTVAVIALWVGLAAIGSLFNLPDSRELLLAVGVFAMALAYLYRLGLPLLLGIGALGGWLWSLAAIPLGLFWRDAFGLSDPLVPLGVICLAIPAVIRRPAGFAPVWRTIGAIAFGMGVLITGLNGQFSAMDGGIDRPYIEAAYQVLAAIALPLLVVIGVRRDWGGVTVVGVIFLILFLLTRLSAWFWDYLPKWLFFLLVGVLALLVLLLLRQLRARRATA
jgi:hypothetical protein